MLAWRSVTPLRARTSKPWNDINRDLATAVASVSRFELAGVDGALDLAAKRRFDPAKPRSIADRTSGVARLCAAGRRREQAPAAAALARVRPQHRREESPTGRRAGRRHRRGSAGCDLRPSARRTGRCTARAARPCCGSGDRSTVPSGRAHVPDRESRPSRCRASRTDSVARVEHVVVLEPSWAGH